MSTIITTSGVGSKFTTDALMGMGATQQDPNGRFYLDGSMVNVELSRVVAETIYIQSIFRDGQSATAKYTANPQRGGAVRVMLDTPLPFSSRTLGYGGRAGTPNNAGVINTNAPLLPANDEFMVYLNQVNDQRMIFPDLSKEYIPMDIMATKISQYAGRVSMDRDASTLAEVLAYAMFRAMNGADNIVPQGNLTADNAYADVINAVGAKLDNGDQLTGAFTYPTEGRTIIGRPRFINNLFSRKSGLIMLGGDMAQEMLKNYDLDVRMADRDYVGTGYKGYAMGFHFQSAPDYIWTLAEKYLGLPAGAFDGVSAIAVSFEATALANGIDLGIKIVDSVDVRGSLAQPLNIWGHEAFRLSYVIADANQFNTDIMSSRWGMTEATRLRPIAPEKANEDSKDLVTVPIYGTDGSIIGYKEIASVPKPNGDNIQSGLKKVRGFKAVLESGVGITLSTTTPGTTIYYTTSTGGEPADPTSASAVYSTPIQFETGVVVKAIATKAGMIPASLRFDGSTLNVEATALAISEEE